MKNPSIICNADKMVVFKVLDYWVANCHSSKDDEDYLELGEFPSHAQALRAAVEWAENQRAYKAAW